MRQEPQSIQIGTSSMFTPARATASRPIAPAPSASSGSSHRGTNEWYCTAAISRSSSGRISTRTRLAPATARHPHSAQAQTAATVATLSQFLL